MIQNKVNRRLIRLFGLSVIGLGMAACTTISQAGTGNSLCANNSSCNQGAAVSQGSPVASSVGTGTPSAAETEVGNSRQSFSSPAQSSDTAAPPNLPQYLADINYADTNTANVGTGEGHIDKQVYPNTVWLCFDIESISNINCDSSSAPYWVDYNVPAGYSNFSTTIGYSDDSPSNCDATVQIFGDGTQLYSRELYFGNLVPVNYVVRKYLRIRLQIVPIQGMDCVTDFGNAEFISKS